MIWLNQENVPTHVVNLIQIPTCLQLLEFLWLILEYFINNKFYQAVQHCSRRLEKVISWELVYSRRNLI